MTTPLSPTSTWTSKTGEVTRMPVMTTRRGGHGGTAWSLPFAEQMLLQPQDGAVDPRTRLANISSHQHSDVLNEPEDARLTGGTRSLTRRLLGLNVGTTRKAPEAVTEVIKRTEVA
jgi:hypothetical protein